MSPEMAAQIVEGELQKRKIAYTKTRGSKLGQRLRSSSTMLREAGILLSQASFLKDFPGDADVAGRFTGGPRIVEGDSNF